MGGYEPPELTQAKGVVADSAKALTDLILAFLCRNVPGLSALYDGCPTDPDATGLASDAEDARSARNSAAASGGGIPPQNVTGGYN